MYVDPSDDDDAYEPLPSPPKAPVRKCKATAKAKKKPPPHAPCALGYKEISIHAWKTMCLKNLYA